SECVQLRQNADRVLPLHGRRVRGGGLHRGRRARAGYALPAGLSRRRHGRHPGLLLPRRARFDLVRQAVGGDDQGVHRRRDLRPADGGNLRLVVAALTAAAVLAWRLVQPGVELTTTGPLTVVRVDPAAAQVTVALASEQNVAPRTAAEWCRTSRLA